MVDSPNRTYESPGNFIISSSLKNVWINGESNKTGIVIMMETMNDYVPGAAYDVLPYLLSFILMFFGHTNK